MDNLYSDKISPIQYHQQGRYISTILSPVVNDVWGATKK